MTEVMAYKVSLNDKDGGTYYYSLTSSSTSISTVGGSNHIIVHIGGSYAVTVESVNSVGTSKTDSSLFGELIFYFSA